MSWEYWLRSLATQDGKTPRNLKTTMSLLNAEEINQKLRDSNGWRLTPRGIEKRFEMENFPSVMNLVNRVADLAEEANHHPDILISYSQVTFTLTTHDAGGITEKDFDLAQRIEAIAP